MSIPFSVAARGLAVGTCTAALLAGSLGATSSSAATVDYDHGVGPMGESPSPRVNARVAAGARTTSVSPTSGPDFEMPFGCGKVWTGDSRSSHSPSYYTVDFNAPDDFRQPTLASAAGVVTKTVHLTGSYGRYIVIDHGGGYTTLYAHLDEILVTPGTYVDQGEMIGRVGTSGGSTGPHLHFEERKDGAYFPPYFHRTRFAMGSTQASRNCSDKPIAGDWNGDGRAELGVFRPVGRYATVNQRLASGASQRFYLGYNSNRPFTGNWSKDRRSEVGNQRRGSSTYNLRRADGSAWYMSLGRATDLPAFGDFNGNGATEPGWYRPSTREFWRRGGGGFVRIATFGGSGARPAMGDWNGDGRTDVGVYYPATATWSLRVPTAGGATTRTISFGRPGDLPVTGDWNGDRTTDVGVWRPSTATFVLRTATTAGRVTTQSIAYGVRR